MLIGGTYVQPRIVKAIVDSQTGERKEVEVIKKDRVISEETAKNVLSMMESVVAEKKKKNAQVKGYRIGGPTGEGGHQGGGVAAPIGAQIFGEVLPYLEIPKDDENNVEVIEQVEVPNVEGLTVEEADKILEELGLEMYTEEEQTEEIDAKNTIIRSQTPSKGITVNKGSNVFVEF